MTNRLYDTGTGYREENNVRDETITLIPAGEWDQENVYLFPKINREPRGVLWVIPPPSITNMQYKDDEIWHGQHFAMDQIKYAITRGDINQYDWIIVIGPSSRQSVEMMTANATDTFKENGFNHRKHIDLCGCCTDAKDRDYVNCVIAMGDGANAVDFNDPTLTNIILADPLIYPPVNIPPDVVGNIFMVNSPNNWNDGTEEGNAAIEGQQQIAEQIGDNAKTDLTEGTNFAAMVAAALSLFPFALGILQGAANLAAGTGSAGYDPLIYGDDAPTGSFADPAAKVEEDKPPEIGPVQGSGDYDAPQVVITSDRLLFNARSDAVLISAGTHIGLSSLQAVGVDAGYHFTVNTPNIYLGLGSTEPLVLGHELGSWCESLIWTIQHLTYTNAGGPTGYAVNAASLDPVKAAIPQFKSPQNYTL